MEQFADINGVHMHFSETGDPKGKPVVLMHGWGCEIATVASIAEALEPGKRAISIDLPGHGMSSEPPLLPDGKPWGVYEYAECVEILLKSISVKNPVLIGHSYGGRLAIIIGSRTPVEKIVLVDSAGIKPKRSVKYYAKVYSFKLMKKFLPLFIGKKRADKRIEKRRQKSGSSDYRNASPMMRMVMSRSVNQDLKSLLPKITAPTLLIWGENDTATPLSDARIMEKRIPDAGLVVFPGAGHYSFLDNPARFKAVLKSFLDPIQ